MELFQPRWIPKDNEAQSHYSNTLNLQLRVSQLKDSTLNSQDNNTSNKVIKLVPTKRENRMHLGTISLPASLRRTLSI